MARPPAVHAAARDRRQAQAAESLNWTTEQLLDYLASLPTPFAGQA